MGPSSQKQSTPSWVRTRSAPTLSPLPLPLRTLRRCWKAVLKRPLCPPARAGVHGGPPSAGRPRRSGCVQKRRHQSDDDHGGPLRDGGCEKLAILQHSSFAAQARY